MAPKKKAKIDTPAAARSKNEKNSESDEEVSDEEPTKPNPRKRGRNQGQTKSQEPLKNQTSTEFHSQDFSCESKTEDGQSWNLKIASWNVDGLRAWVKKGGLGYVDHENPDILCLQETKCSKDKLPKEVNIPGYHIHWCDGETEGYAGLGLYSKEKPLKVTYGLGNPEFDKEGRLITAEFEKFFLVNVYVPNAGRKLVTLPKRMEWDPLFRKYLKKLDETKPVIICGDLNVAHQEIDIANPKSNKKNAGFTPEEREGFTKLLDEGFVDSFRHKYPEVKGAYTFWTYMANARKKNVGWRLDYCLISKQLMAAFCDCLIRSQVFGSDHCPVVLFMHIR